MKKIILIAFLYITNSVFAINIGGTVFLAQSENPISACNIFVIQDGKIVEFTSTNAMGVFSLNLEENQNYTLEFLKPNHNVEKIEFNTSNNESSINSKLKVNLVAFNSVSIDSKKDNLNKVDEPNSLSIENVGDLSKLPQGYKLIEVKSLHQSEKERSGFNVQDKNNLTQAEINVNQFKTAFNKESLKANISIDKEGNPSSYFLNGYIYYGSGKVLLSDEVMQVLNAIALKINYEENVTLSIKAFADSNREIEVGTEVAKLRAEEIINYLMKQNVDFSKLHVSTTGNSVLENECYRDVECSEIEHQQNRKVELMFVED